MRMELIAKYQEVKRTIPGNVKLVAVSKFKRAETILELYEHAGHRFFGESRAQELFAKQQVLPGDIEWHFIGHLQTNKVKLVLPFTSLIHSVDSYKLVKEINKEASRIDKVAGILLQFHIASEETKFGFSLEEGIKMLEDHEFSNLTHVKIRGVMGMASLSNNIALVRKEFKSLKAIFEKLHADYFMMDDSFKEISMGMSGDYNLAIEEGSTMVRVGSSIFGERS